MIEDYPVCARTAAEQVDNDAESFLFEELLANGLASPNVKRGWRYRASCKCAATITRSRKRSGGAGFEKRTGSSSPFSAF